MGKDYYKILGIARDATDEDIKKAYRKLALKWHPDRNLDKKKESEQKFQELAHAYEVLSDKQKRAIFDQFGEEGLQAGGPEPGDGGGFSAGPRMSGGVRGGFRDPADIFAQFFGSSNPFAAFGGGGDDEGGGGLPGGFTFMSSGGGFPMGGMGGVGGMPMGGMPMGGMPGGVGGAGAKRRGPQKAEPIKRQLLLTLEDLYSGTLKRIKITRQRLSGSGGGPQTEEKILEVAVKPGWKKGTTITFENEGDEAPGVIPADIQFIVGEKEHATFTRDGNNLIYNARLTLADALCGTTLRIATLDGRTISVPVSEVVSPGSEKVVRGEGMPVPKAPTTKGDLIVRFSVAFPAYLSDDKKAQLRRLLT